MNKTDMSNPASIYCLSTSLCCTKEADKLRHASRMKEWRNEGVEGGVEENVPRSRSTGVRSVATEPGRFESPKNS